MDNKTQCDNSRGISFLSVGGKDMTDVAKVHRACVRKCVARSTVRPPQGTIHDLYDFCKPAATTKMLRVAQGTREAVEKFHHCGQRALIADPRKIWLSYQNYSCDKKKLSHKKELLKQVMIKI